MQELDHAKDAHSATSKVDEPVTSIGSGEQPMSKSQMKKLARRQRMLDMRIERRKIEKEKKKAKRRALAKARQETASDGNNQHVVCQPKRTKLMSESDNKFRIVIDMDFNDLMTDDEIGKAAKQVGRIYSLNRHSDRPCQLHLTSLKGRIKERFAKTNAGYHNWDINISDADYLELFCDDKSSNRDNFIYLTGDSDVALPDANELRQMESKIFVIGGLVDHNRHKSLCLDRAKERGLSTAKLPIGEYVQLCQRHILSTVTVFEILLNVLATGMDWREAFLASIPKRKLAPNSRGSLEHTSKEDTPKVLAQHQASAIDCEEKKTVTE